MYAAFRHPGFTLVEVLVTLVILGVMLGAVTLALGHRDPAGTEAAHLNAVILAGCRQRAILESRTLGLEVGSKGWTIAGLEGGTWLPLPERNAAGKWSSELTVALEIGGRPAPLVGERALAPQILCHATGQMTPFVLRFTAAGDRRVLWGYSDGRLENDPPSGRR